MTMTREEAITIIDNLHLIGSGRNQHENDLKINVALDMAIEALTHEIHTETHDNDLISKMSKPISMEESLKDIEPWYEDDNLSEPMTSEELFKDLGIDDEVDAVSCKDTVTPNGPITIQTEMVPVVRCKDCKHQEHCHETVAHTKEHDGFREHWSEPIEWCSRGKCKGGLDE